MSGEENCGRGGGTPLAELRRLGSRLLRRPSSSGEGGDASAAGACPVDATPPGADIPEAPTPRASRANQTTGKSSLEPEPAGAGLAAACRAATGDAGPGAHAGNNEGDPAPRARARRRRAFAVAAKCAKLTLVWVLTLSMVMTPGTTITAAYAAEAVGEGVSALAEGVAATVAELGESGEPAAQDAGDDEDEAADAAEAGDSADDTDGEGDVAPAFDASTRDSRPATELFPSPSLEAATPEAAEKLKDMLRLNVTVDESANITSTNKENGLGNSYVVRNGADAKVKIDITQGYAKGHVGGIIDGNGNDSVRLTIKAPYLYWDGQKTAETYSKSEWSAHNTNVPESDRARMGLTFPAEILSTWDMFVSDDEGGTYTQVRRADIASSFSGTIVLRYKGNGNFQLSSDKIDAIEATAKFAGKVKENTGAKISTSITYFSYTDNKDKYVSEISKSADTTTQSKGSIYWIVLIHSSLKWRTELKLKKAPTLWDRWNYAVYTMTIENISDNEDSIVTGQEFAVYTTNAQVSGGGRNGVTEEGYMSWQYVAASDGSDGSVGPDGGVPDEPSSDDNFKSVNPYDQKWSTPAGKQELLEMWFAGKPMKGGFLAYDVTDVPDEDLAALDLDSFGNAEQLGLKTLPYRHTTDELTAFRLMDWSDHNEGRDTKLYPQAYLDAHPNEDVRSKVTLLLAVPYTMNFDPTSTNDDWEFAKEIHTRVDNSVFFGEGLKENSYSWSIQDVNDTYPERPRISAEVQKKAVDSQNNDAHVDSALVGAGNEESYVIEGLTLTGNMPVFGPYDNMTEATPEGEEHANLPQGSHRGLWVEDQLPQNFVLSSFDLKIKADDVPHSYYSKAALEIYGDWRNVTERMKELKDKNPDEYAALRQKAAELWLNQTYNTKDFIEYETGVDYVGDELASMVAPGGYGDKKKWASLGASFEQTKYLEDSDEFTWHVSIPGGNDVVAKNGYVDNIRYNGLPRQGEVYPTGRIRFRYMNRLSATKDGNKVGGELYVNGVAPFYQSAPLVNKAKVRYTQRGYMAKTGANDAAYLYKDLESSEAKAQLTLERPVPTVDVQAYSELTSTTNWGKKVLAPLNKATSGWWVTWGSDAKLSWTIPYEVYIPFYEKWGGSGATIRDRSTAGAVRFEVDRITVPERTITMGNFVRLTLGKGSVSTGYEFTQGTTFSKDALLAASTASKNAGGTGDVVLCASPKNAGELAWGDGVLAGIRLVYDGFKPNTPYGKPEEYKDAPMLDIHGKPTVLTDIDLAARVSNVIYSTAPASPNQTIHGDRVEAKDYATLQKTVLEPSILVKSYTADNKTQLESGGRRWASDSLDVKYGNPYSGYGIWVGNIVTEDLAQTTATLSLDFTGGGLHVHRDQGKEQDGFIANRVTISKQVHDLGKVASIVIKRYDSNGDVVEETISRDDLDDPTKGYLAANGNYVLGSDTLGDKVLRGIDINFDNVKKLTINGRSDPMVDVQGVPEGCLEAMPLTASFGSLPAKDDAGSTIATKGGLVASFVRSVISFFTGDAADVDELYVEDTSTIQPKMENLVKGVPYWSGTDADPSGGATVTSESGSDDDASANDDVDDVESAAVLNDGEEETDGSAGLVEADADADVSTSADAASAKYSAPVPYRWGEAAGEDVWYEYTFANPAGAPMPSGEVAVDMDTVKDSAEGNHRNDGYDLRGFIVDRLEIDGFDASGSHQSGAVSSISLYDYKDLSTPAKTILASELPALLNGQSTLALGAADCGVEAFGRISVAYKRPTVDYTKLTGRVSDYQMVVRAYGTVHKDETIVTPVKVQPPFCTPDQAATSSVSMPVSAASPASLVKTFRQAGDHPGIFEAGQPQDDKLVATQYEKNVGFRAYVTNDSFARMDHAMLEYKLEQPESVLKAGDYWRGFRTHKLVVSKELVNAAAKPGSTTSTLGDLVFTFQKKDGSAKETATLPAPSSRSST